MKLYEINHELKRLFESADPETGEITSELESDIRQLGLLREKKALDTARYIKNLEAESAAIKAEREKLQARERALNNRAESVRNYLYRQIPKESYSDANTRISWGSSESVALSEDFVPRGQFKRVKIEPDKEEIRKHLKAGGKLKGARMVNKPYIKIG
jgi:seryl-tRNA synthetase